MGDRLQVLGWRESFLDAWSQLERVGAVDGAGGAQYRRAAAAWVAAGRPRRILGWLRVWAWDDDRARPGPGPDGKGAL
jgi:hypothetical protein